MQEKTGGGYEIAFSLDSTGNQMLLDLIGPINRGPSGQEGTSTIGSAEDPFVISVWGDLDASTTPSVITTYKLLEGTFTKEEFQAGNFTKPSPGSSSLSPKPSPPASLVAHVLMMVVAWGFLLPFGVSAAFCERNFGKSRFFEDTDWFTLHFRLQVAGWAMQLGGVIAAIVYCQLNSVHLFGTHPRIGAAVVFLGTLQPLNALFRPHSPKEGWEKEGGKPATRVVWEVSQKESFVD